jgi:TolA-binding protein
MIRASLCLLLTAAALAAADKPNRDILELQREMAQLDQKIGAMQQALEARLTAMTAQIQTVADAAAQINTNAAALQKSIAQVAQDQDRKLVPAIAQQGTRLDQFGGTLSTMQQALADLTASVNHLQTQVVDVGNAVKVISSPAAAPPKPPAADLLHAAQADRLGNKNDLAVQEYSEFLTLYPDAPEADIAQFELGLTHRASDDHEAAIRDFDTLAARYAESKKLPEALYLKSKSLQALKRAAAARAACADLRKKFPTSEFVRQCPVRP